MTFPCTKCGLCCTKVSKVAHILNALPDTTLHFPYSWNDKGHCEKLQDNLCSVYETRPKVCQVGLMGGSYLDSAKVCNQMMDEEGLPPELRIDLTQIKED
jgi:Fe-S-cluster containining protein